MSSPIAPPLSHADWFQAGAVTPVIAAMQGSLILQIAAEVRELISRGRPVCNLTVGDFDPKQFPIPALLAEGTNRAVGAGQTQYPPSEGIPELRRAISGWYQRRLGFDAPVANIVVASGARPAMYATYRMILDPGDELVYAVPSWNNGYYGQLCQAQMVPVVTRPEDDFFPTAALLAPKLRTARLLTLNSPLNPTGTMIGREQLAAIATLVAEENRRRGRSSERPLLWMWDQVYWQLTFGPAHHHPSVLVPEVAPYVITVDAISKAFAATGLRVGWAVAHPYIAERMKSFLGHVGSWAPRPIQVATAELLDNDVEADRYLRVFRSGLQERLAVIHEALTQAGVVHLAPQGAMYLSIQLDRLGRPGVGGAPIRNNEDTRRWLLEAAGVAVVPFQAFDLPEDSGWFRMSIGAVSLPELRAGMARLVDALR